MIVCRKEYFIRRAVPSALPYEAWRECPFHSGKVDDFTLLPPRIPDIVHVSAHLVTNATARKNKDGILERQMHLSPLHILRRSGLPDCSEKVSSDEK
jgi:hypothetical protein